MMNENVYQKMFDEISAFLPENWKKTVIYIEYGEDSYSFSFYYKNEKEYKKCFDIPGIAEEDIMNSFKKIDQIISAEREKTNGDLWSNMTMVVDCEGNMKVDFDYSDLSKGTYEYKKAWRGKYLK